MGETDNIARMAEKVFSDIFEVFGWSKTGPVNHNWACINEDHDKKTHPSDVVFWYDDPYRPLCVYWNVDLKSYKASTIRKERIGGAIRSLAMAVDCANASEAWQTSYVQNGSRFRCDGMLFVYNHDGDYTGDFEALLKEADQTVFDLPTKRRMVLFGPADVDYLFTIANDMLVQRSKNAKDGELLITPQFWFPDLVRPKLHTQRKSAATIEMLTGPWITTMVPPDRNGDHRKFTIYYKSPGDSIDEFKYLIDSFFRFQMLSVDKSAEICVRLFNPAPSAFSNFNNAKDAIAETLYHLTEKRLDAVKCESITRIVPRFSEDEIGLESR